MAELSYLSKKKMLQNCMCISSYTKIVWFTKCI